LLSQVLPGFLLGLFSVSCSVFLFFARAFFCFLLGLSIFFGSALYVGVFCPRAADSAFPFILAGLFFGRAFRARSKAPSGNLQKTFIRIFP
jgi:hypothetical protein